DVEDEPGSSSDRHAAEPEAVPSAVEYQDDLHLAHIAAVHVDDTDAEVLVDQARRTDPEQAAQLLEDVALSWYPPEEIALVLGDAPCHDVGVPAGSRSAPEGGRLMTSPSVPGRLDGITPVPSAVNEPVLGYAPGSPERAEVESTLRSLAAEKVDLTCTIDGKQRMGGGEAFNVVQPHAHHQVLGVARHASTDDAQAALDAARAAAPGWRALSYDDRAATFLRAAQMLSGPWRQTINAATMLGQGKTVQQSEIDAVCELIDFWRFNAHFARQIMDEQPVANSPGVWNRLDHRPLEGFVYAITPFNFTAIAGNLPTAPALMGNTVIWKPSPTQALAAHFTMQLLEAAGMPPGVINLLGGDGS